MPVPHAHCLGVGADSVSVKSHSHTEPNLGERHMRFSALLHCFEMLNTFWTKGATFSFYTRNYVSGPTYDYNYFFFFQY